ncbi:hypothetical protein F4808DRAFT_414243 [Astrocystis sublimbata]|nr:hypothetical protein F4808DRAFT_414243 [Astrocystis sublimbata]
MPQDPDLYGQKRPAKKQKREIPLSSSLAFTSQLSSLISAPATDSTSTPHSSSSFSSGRSRPSKTKDDIFSVKAKRKPGTTTTTTTTTKNAKDDGDGGGSSSSSKIRLKHVHNTEEEKQDFARARRKMEEKARLYAAMKRGDYVAKDNEAAPLVDFDRKWAERHPEDDGGNVSSSDADDNDSDGEQWAGNETVEYTDEFGRTRTGTRAEAQRHERRVARAALGASELDDMAAVPTARPANLIYGDAIQTAAFAPEGDTLDAMAALAAKRDREPTPPPDTHFDGNAEIRTKGTGFYHFSRDEAARAREMENLKAERETTERVRRERESEREHRKKDIEARRKMLGKRRAEKLADNFLDGLAGEMAVAGAGAAEQSIRGDESPENEHAGTKERGDSKPVSAAEIDA